MNNNIGFRQYKLPIDVDMILNEPQKVTNVDFVVDESHPLSSMVDGQLNTYCKLEGTPSNKIKITLASSSEDAVFCSSIKIIFNNKMRQVLIRDNNNNIILNKSNSTRGFSIVEEKINKEFKRLYLQFRALGDTEIIKISNLEIYNNKLINSIEPPEGYYIKDIEIQSVKVEEGEINGN